MPLAELVAAAADERADPEARAAGRLAAGVTAYGLGRRDLAEALLGPFRAADRCARESAGAPWRAPSSDTSPGQRGDLAEAAALYTAARTTHVRLGNTEGHRVGRPRPRPARARRGPARRGGAAAHRVAGAVRLDRLRLGGRGLLLAARLGGRTPGERRRRRRAAALLARALRLHDEVGDRRGIAQCLEGMAEVALARAPRPRPRGSSAPRPPAGSGRPPSRPRPRRGAWPTSTSAWTACWTAPPPSASGTRAGRCRPPPCSRWPRVTAVGTEDGAGRRADAAAAGGGRSVAAGRTNRQIGTALGISEKTAEVHVHNIMERLDVPSRAGVAAWAAARGLTRPAPP